MKRKPVSRWLFNWNWLSGFAPFCLSVRLLVRLPACLLAHLSLFMRWNHLSVFCLSLSLSVCPPACKPTHFLLYNTQFSLSLSPRKHRSKGQKKVPAQTTIWWCMKIYIINTLKKANNKDLNKSHIYHCNMTKRSRKSLTSSLPKTPGKSAISTNEGRHPGSFTIIIHSSDSWMSNQSVPLEQPLWLESF